MAAKRIDLEGLPHWPRLLSGEQAAAYLGVTAPTLKTLGIKPRSLRGRVLYDRHDLDRYADALAVGGGDIDTYLDRL
jgi:hypothetical protein